MKRLLLKISMVLLSIHSLNCQNKIDYDCLDGLWQRMSLRSSSNEKFYDIFHNNNWISIYSCNYKDSLYLQINTYKFGYVDLKRDSVDVNIIINHGKYYVETEYAKSKTNKAKVLFINEDYSISCDEESYNWTNDINEKYRRLYLPIKIWNQMQLYCQEKGIKLFEEFNLEKYNPHIRIVNAILYNDKEKKAITKKLEGINDAVVLEQLWDMLMVKGRTFEGWIDSKDVF